MPSQDSKQHDEGTYTIKTMTRDELVIAVEWAAAEGWNPGRYDVDCFYAADPNGFLMGFLNDQPIASISVVKYSDTFGFLGFYMVRPAFRGRGYGIQIWKAGLSYLQERNIGLDGVVEQQENYAKSGFKIAHRNIRYQAFGPLNDQLNAQLNGQLDDESARDLSEETLQTKISDRTSLVSLSSLPIEVINDYDESIFLGRRSAFLRCWLSLPQHVAIGLVHNNKLAGYGVLRPCQQGYKMGPLFADTPAFAEDIFLALRTRVQHHAPFYLDVPSVNAAAVELVKKYSMTSVFETARMYTRKPPELPLHKIFGITTFELG